MREITRRFHFDSGHRIWGHETKCKYVHGHRYTAEVTIQTESLDSLGRVVDFGEVKKIIGTWINDNWDHNLLLNSHDKFGAMDAISGRTSYLFPGKNPTAENIAEELAKQAKVLLSHYTHLVVRHVRIYETPDCFADFYCY